MEYGGREDDLVKEKYLYKNGKFDGLQILRYKDGLHVEEIYKNGKLIPKANIEKNPLRILSLFKK